MDFLTPNSLPDILQKAMMQYDLNVGQRLFRTGDPANAVYVVASGRLQLLSSTIGDKLAVLQVAEPGSLLGEEALFSEYYLQSAIAKAHSHIIVYPKSEILIAMRNYAELSADFVMRLVHKVKALEANLEIRSIKASHHRVLRHLQRLASIANNENIVHIDRPLKEIATEVDITAETLSRALLKLEKTGDILRRNGDIILLSDSPHVA